MARRREAPVEGRRAGSSGGNTRGGKAGEPIAVVGMACKFPGANDLDAFWRLLVEGGNSVTEGLPGSGGERLADLFGDPESRNEACRYGAFVEGIEQFDAAFFRISPVEAQLLDPQQRMMLEVSWRGFGGRSASIRTG